MPNDLLAYHAVQNCFADIRKEVASVAARDPLSPVSDFEKFFWLKARQGPTGVEFLPTAQCRHNHETDFWICNLVLKGGGTLGLAHVGFTAALEQAGIRFAGLAGTSAGSIVALGLAAVRGGDLLKETTPEMVALTSSVPMDWFIDGPGPVRKLIKHLLQGRSLLLPRCWFWLARAWKRILTMRGLNPGDSFETWLEGIMRRYEVASLTQLDARLEEIFQLLEKANADLAALGLDLRALETVRGTRQDQIRSLLKLYTSAMPVGLKFELPRQMTLLEHEPQTLSPARLVRMSMSIPAFFEPVRMPLKGKVWRDGSESPLVPLQKLVSASEAREYRDLEALNFVDGGMFANLPSDAFDENLSSLPTLLVPLIGAGKAQRYQRSKRGRVVVQEALQCVAAMRVQRDLDAYLQRVGQAQAFNARHDPLIREGKAIPRSFPLHTCPIDTGEANWLNFTMGQRDQQELFLAGVTAARDFITDLTATIRTREGLVA